MRIRLFGRIVYLPRGALIIAGVLAAAAVIVIINITENNTLPEIERIAQVTEENGSGITVTPGSGELIDHDASAQATNGPDEDTAAPAPTVDMRMAVHITGAVAAEGVYRLGPGSIVQDVVELCGGLLPDADTYSINLAMKVNDGMRIHIPFTYSEDKMWLLDVGYASAASPGSSVSGDNGSGLVNINTASVNELITLSGIGESTAREIIAFREEYGRFETIEDIMNVPGIKEAKFARIKKYITV